MTPAARVQAAIEILSALEATQKPADRFLRDWFRSRRYAGSKDRAAVAERVFSVLRHRASLAWRMNSEAPRALAIASLLREGIRAGEVEGIFSGHGYGPAPLSADERQQIAAPSRDEPTNVRGEFPAWLEPELQRAFGDDLLEETRALSARASIDIRVNALKADRSDVLARLRADGYAVEPTPFAPYGLRSEPGEGAAALNRHPLYLSGAFEFQDEAAQIASHLCRARPGNRVLDLAAGAGGKSLALSADMKNEGEIVACDIRADVLEELRSRAARAGATLIRPHLGEPPPGEFDIVVVDAPCSGSGTWRRQPELKWRLTPGRLEEFHRTQDGLLRKAAPHVRKGGRLIYMTCSILPSENVDRVERFGAERRCFAVCPIDAERCFFVASPRKTSTDGFFTAIMDRAVE
jgi:16S rRNA (cytosine967-C5)-methyltransferase